MTQKAIPGTSVLERHYPHAIARVFRAWSEPKAFVQWHAPGSDWVNADHALDFRVGGRVMIFFGPKGAPRYRSEGRFEDIAKPMLGRGRIITSDTMFDEQDKSRFTSTLLTVEFAEELGGTRLTLTDQSIFYGFEPSDDRKSGLAEILEKLDIHMKGHP
jgi:uncharacterized protein YndB with AHSA1/START domain